MAEKNARVRYFIRNDRVWEVILLQQYRDGRRRVRFVIDGSIEMLRGWHLQDLYADKAAALQWLSTQLHLQANILRQRQAEVAAELAALKRETKP